MIMNGNKEEAMDLFANSKTNNSDLLFQAGLRLAENGNTETAAEKYNAILVASVLTNLVFNAIRYTAKGRVGIILGKESFSVTDTGSGISATEKERIFDTGYRGKQGLRQESAGYGLGLSIASRICHILNWKIAMKSREGVGTTFSVTFHQDDGTPS